VAEGDVSSIRISPNTGEPLLEYLLRIGWSVDIAVDAGAAYQQGGVEEARRVSKWMDDDEHDYSGEITDDIQHWREATRPSDRRLMW
jgi:hypothetical protein